MIARSQPRSYRIQTLGCRVNHAETREMEAILRTKGLFPAARGDTADLEIIHSCTVTQQASAKSRQALRQALRRSGKHQAPELTNVLLTGCYAGSNPDEVNAIGGAGTAIPQSEDDSSTMMDRLSAAVDHWLARCQHADGSLQISEYKEFTSNNQAPHSDRKSVIPLPIVELPQEPARHVRAEVRLQDGCDAHCTFCIIPSIRRTLRSKTVVDAVAEATRLVDLGHPEIVLSGIFLGAYGHETALRRKQADPGAEHLAEVLHEVAQITGIKRLRISSLEPGDFSPALLDAMLANQPVVVPHLHLPLQSGSDRILKRMNRQYTVHKYLEMIEMAKEGLTESTGPMAGVGPAITTDIICGFPGETDEDFEATRAVVDRCKYLHMHVFPFSPRQGTAAARWRGSFVDNSVKKARVKALIALEEDPVDGYSIQYRRQLVGRRVRVILEQPARDGNPFMTGRCDHYALIHVAGADPLMRGEMVEVEITGLDGARTEGELVGVDRRVPLDVIQ